jgi:predicted metal-dependent hydrolase
MHRGHEQVEINLGERRAVAELRRTTRRVLRIEVKPSGDVTVFAPIGEEHSTIQDRLKCKGTWIFREIDRIASRPAITPERRFVSGESHFLLGRQYRLSIEQSDDPHVRVEGTRLRMLARDVDDQAHCRRLLIAFYAITARKVFSERLDAMVLPFIRKGLKKPSLIVRKMATRWGSYTPKGRIILNVDLVRASPQLIDYVICHELAHGFHPNHGKEWRDMLYSAMPDWEKRKARLEEVLR